MPRSAGVSSVEVSTMWTNSALRARTGMLAAVRPSRSFCRRKEERAGELRRINIVGKQRFRDIAGVVKGVPLRRGTHKTQGAEKAVDESGRAFEMAVFMSRVQQVTCWVGPACGSRFAWAFLTLL